MTTATAEKTLPRLKQKYREEIAPALHEQFGYDNVMQIPGLTKIVVNMGVGDAARDSKVIDGAVRDVAEIRQREFPLFARDHTHRGPYKDGPGEINVPVSIDGMIVMPGDVIIGDDDGLLAFPPQEAATLIDKALAQQAKEEATIQAILENRWDLSFVDALEARCQN